MKEKRKSALKLTLEFSEHFLKQAWGKEEPLALDANYTSEIEILKIIKPLQIKPYLEQIDNSSTLNSLISIRNELLQLKVLDPACSKGNFLHLAYSELKRLESLLLGIIRQ